MSGILVPKPMLGRQLPGGRARGLVGFWLFNEGTGNKVSDLSGNGITGVLTGDVSWSIGDYGSQLTFPGTDDYIPLSNTRISNWDDSSITIITRFSTTDVTTEQRIFARGSSSGNNPSFQIISGAVRGLVGEVSDGGGGLIVGSSVGISNNVKYDLVLTFDKSRMKIYLDGVEKADDVAATNIGSGEQFTCIGARKANLQSDFFGDIEYFYIYNRALNASEIAELYLRPFAMFDRMPIELWVGATSVGVPPVGQPMMRRWANIPHMRYLGRRSA